MQQLIEFEIELFGNSTLDFAEYEQNSLQAGLRKMRQQAIADAAANPTNSTNFTEISTSTNHTNNGHTEMTTTTETTTNVTTNATTNNNTTILNANTNTNTTTTHTTTTHSPDVSPIADKKKDWKYHFHRPPTPTPHHLPHINLECIS
jgi:hypothetical protein